MWKNSFSEIKNNLFTPIGSVPTSEQFPFITVV